ncbi:hypothetical protein B0H19DRAFT_524710 [Mycena capillaripes]|nr:hypothetical protein B0H19DRAFT_524710 [Mycena capillaripes]
MPSKITAAIAQGIETVLVGVLVVLCGPPLLCYWTFLGDPPSMCGTGRIQRRAEQEQIKRWKDLNIPPDLPPLPTARIDIRRRPVAKQPRSCYLLKLPLELRQCIYEQVLAGRLVSLEVIEANYHKYSVIRSRFYLPDDDLAHAPTRHPYANQISIALLRSCRQVYTEAVPILHRRNTFHIRASQLEVVVRSGLGEYCLPDIRSVYICHSFPCSSFWVEHPWRTVFGILQQMNLERVAFEFELEPTATELDPYRAEIDGSWGRSVLGLRNLCRLELWLDRSRIRSPPEDLVDKTELLAKLRELMIAPGADERYRIFLEQSKPTGKKADT